MPSRKTALILVCLLGFASAAKSQTATIDVDAGALLNAGGVGGEPTGGLLQLIASPTGTFSPPTPSNYVTGNNVLVDSFAMNMNGGAEETFSALNGVSLSGLTTGEDLFLRFYPSITYSPATNYATTGPTLLATYGQVRSDAVEFGSAGGVPSETGWFVPGMGSTVTLEYVTTSNTGTYANATAYASNVVVPEPATYALLASGLVGLLGLRAWRVRRIAA